MTTYQDEWKNSDFYKDIINNKKTIIDINYLYNKFNFSFSKYSLLPENLKYVKFIDKHGKEKYVNEKTKKKYKERADEIETRKRENLTLVSLIAKRKTLLKYNFTKRYFSFFIIFIYIFIMFRISNINNFFNKFIIFISIEI